MKVLRSRTLRLMLASVVITFSAVVFLTSRVGEAEGMWFMAWLLSILLQGLAAFAFTTYASPKTILWAQRVLIPVAVGVAAILASLSIRHMV